MHIVLSGIDIIRIEGENSSRYQVSMKKSLCVGRAMAVFGGCGSCCFDAVRPRLGAHEIKMK